MFAGRTIMSPRLTSTSSSSVNVTAWPEEAESRVPSQVTMLASLLRRPLGSTTTSSPTETDPDSMLPW